MWTRFRPLALVTLAGAAPSPAAQVLDVVSGLFDSVNSVAFYAQAGTLPAGSSLQGTGLAGGTGGLGVEVLLDLPSPSGSSLELGLGTGVIGAFEAREPSLDLRGSVRVLPRVAVYLAGLGLPDEIVTPYLGVGFGIAEFWNATGYATDGTAYALEATTYEIGVSAGLAVEVPPLTGLFVQAEYNRRRFDGLRWDGSPLPGGWPRAIDASSWSVALGWQFRLTGPEDV